MGGLVDCSMSGPFGLFVVCLKTFSCTEWSVGLANLAASISFHLFLYLNVLTKHWRLAVSLVVVVLVLVEAVVVVSLCQLSTTRTDV